MVLCDITGRKEEYFILWQYCHLIYNADIKTLAKSFVSKVKYRYLSSNKILNGSYLISYSS